VAAGRGGGRGGGADLPSLDGLPLALELAASRLRALSTAEIAARLGDGLVVLDASIEASHRLLAPAEQELFRRLSVFEGAFGIEDAEHVAPATACRARPCSSC